MVKKLLVILGFSILLTSCKLDSVNRVVDYQNPESKLIQALLTEQEVSEISSELDWYDIFFTQEQDILNPNTSLHYETVQSSYFGNFQDSDHSVMIFHTIYKYSTPIDKNKPTEFLLGGISTYGEVTSYIPEISASGVVVSKCLVEVEKAKQICDVHVQYQYIESDVNITTYNIGKDVMAEWLNAIVSTVEPRILSQDVSE